jgi:branched-chain amino acid transport system permease protein
MGAYTTSYLTTGPWCSPWLTLPLGLLITGVSAYVLGRITLRMSGHYLPLATIAWGSACTSCSARWTGWASMTASPASRHCNWRAGPGWERHLYYLIWAIVLAAAWVSLNLLDSRAGRAIRALKGGRSMAEAMGVDTGRYKILVFVFAALLASGWLFAHMQRTVNPSPFSLAMGIEYLFIVVVGGIAYIWGALLGAGVLKLLSDQLQVLLPALLGDAGSLKPSSSG